MSYNVDDIKKTITESWEECLHHKNKCIFFKALSQDEIFSEIESVVEGLSDDKIVITEDIKENNYSTPYFPMLDFIKKNLKEKTNDELENIFNSREIYPLHRDIFKAFIRDEKLYRDDLLLPAELLYEKKQVQSSISTLFQKVVTSQVAVIILKNINFAHQSTFEIIEHMLKKENPVNLFFILTYDRTEMELNIEEQQRFDDHLTELEDRSETFVINCGHIISNIKNKKEDGISPEITYPLDLINISQIKERINLSNVSYHFLSFEECTNYGIEVFNIIQENPLQVDHHFCFSLLKNLADSNYYLKDYDTSLIYSNMLLNLSQKTNSIDLIAEAYYRISRVYLEKQQYETFKKNIDKTIYQADKSNNNLLIYKSNYLIARYMNKKPEKTDSDRIKYFDHLDRTVTLGEKNKLRNSLCYLYEKIAYNIGNIKEDLEEQISIFDKSIKLSRELKNEYRLSTLLWRKGIVFSYNDRYNDSIPCYMESLQLKIKNGEKFQAARTYNSIGYLYMLIGGFENSIDAFLKSLDFSMDIMNLDEILMSLWNIGQLYFNLREYHRAVHIIKILLKVIRYLKVNSLPEGSMALVYSHMAIAKLKSGDMAGCYNFFSKVEVDESSGEIVFYYNLLSALIDKEKNNFHGAGKIFEKTFDLFSKNNLKKYTLSHLKLLHYEYGLFLKENNQLDEGVKEFKKGLELCNQLGDTFYKNLILKELNMEYDKKDYNIDISTINFDSILIMARQRSSFFIHEKSLNRLHKKVNEVNFLNTLQDLLSKNFEKKALVNDIMNLINNSFIVELSFLYFVESNDLKCFYSSDFYFPDLEKKPENHLSTFNKLASDLSKNLNEKIINSSDIDRDFPFLKDLISSFIYIPIVSKNELIGVLLLARNNQNLSFDRDDLRILNIAAKQFTTAIEKIDLIEKLKKLDKLKNDFIANVTHDFRSPLMVILNMADLAIKFDKNIDDSNIERYNNIYKASLKLKSIIDRLLDLAKMDARGLKLKIGKVNIVNLVGNITDFYISSVIGRGIKIINRLPDHEIEDFYSDFEKLEQILNNILSNAIKFVDPDKGEIIIEVLDDENSVKIIISDNGIGIKKEDLSRIFNRFEQSEVGLNSKYKGSGIGLAFVHQLMGFLKGRVRAESEGIGRGAKFILEFIKGKDIFKQEDIYTLNENSFNNGDIKKRVHPHIHEPIDRDKMVVEITERNQPEEFDIFKSLILIVDDNKYIRYIIRDYLLNSGYSNFIIARDGKEALEAVYDYKPDLIISDYNMPAMRGDELHDKITGHPDFKHIPFIFLSAISDKEIYLDRTEKGAIEYLKKPLDGKELVYTVNMNLKRFFEFRKTLYLSNIDNLTGLYTCSSFTNELSRYISTRKLENFSIIRLDIDNFKGFNNLYGYHTGDRLLKKIGSTILSSIRKYDVAGRYRGDEFIILLPETDLKMAHIVAKKINTNIEKIKEPDESTDLSYSSGISSLFEYEEYICNKLHIDNYKSIYDIKVGDNIERSEIEKKYELLTEIIISMAGEALATAKKNSSKKIVKFTPDNGL